MTSSSYPKLSRPLADEHEAGVPGLDGVPQFVLGRQLFDGRAEKTLGECDNVLAGSIALVAKHVVAS